MIEEQYYDFGKSNPDVYKFEHTLHLDEAADNN